MTDEKQVALHRITVPKKCHSAYDKALSGKSARAAIFQKCLECQNYSSAEVKRCFLPFCPLYPYRNAATLKKRRIDTRSEAQKLVDKEYMKKLRAKKGLV